MSKETAQQQLLLIKWCTSYVTFF